MIYIKKINNDENHNFARSRLWDSISNLITNPGATIKDWFGIKSLGKEIGDNNQLLNGGIPEKGISDSTAEKLLTNKKWAKKVPIAISKNADELLKTERARILLDKKKNNKITPKEEKELDDLMKIHADRTHVAQGIVDGRMDASDYGQLPKDLKKIFDKFVKAQKKAKISGFQPQAGFVGTGLNARNYVPPGDTWWQSSAGNLKYAFDASRATPVGQTVAAPIGAMLRNPGLTTLGVTGVAGYNMLSDDEPEESIPLAPGQKIESLDTSYVDERKFSPPAE